MMWQRICSCCQKIKMKSLTPLCLGCTCVCAHTHMDEHAPNFLKTLTSMKFSQYIHRTAFFVAVKNYTSEQKENNKLLVPSSKISPVTAQFCSLSSSPSAMPAYSFCNINRIVSYMLFHNWLLLFDVSPSCHVIRDFYLPVIFNVLCV